ncbi:MAG: 4-(cytidine 5'-diphospho)-2-C-methyl-D-erythritol kinase [Candidatus Omnitrophota bacterium]
MKSLTLNSPAKLNLYLNILRKRPDGYHDIVTIFERIDLVDRITLTVIPSGIRITSNSREVPLDDSNLAYRAAAMVLQKMKKPLGLHLHLHKRIPVAGGLGGGSSNAATVLAGLNRLLRLSLSQRTLLAMGRALGADVPFFLLDVPFALGTGKGDFVTPIRSSVKLTHLLVKNRVKIPTRQVYQRVNFALTKKDPNVTILRHFVQKGDVPGLAQSCYNVLEKPAIACYPCIAEVRSALETLQLEGVTLSGSGPTFFGFAKSLSHARALRKTILSKHDWDAFVCGTC